MAIPDLLRRHADELSLKAAITVELAEEGSQILVVLKGVRLPDTAYEVGSTDALFLADQLYPLSAMDMFWTDLEVLRPGGAIPEGGDSVETYGGRQWRRFSWHRNGVWRTTGNCLLDHFEFMQSRFAQDVPQ